MRCVLSVLHVFGMLAAIIAPLALCGCGAATGPGDVQASDPAKTVADARRMIEEKRADPKRHSGWICPAELPESLRLPKLVFATVHEDHVNLVLARNPDWQLGARIWSAGAKRKHADKPTKYPEIMFFECSNDKPESPGNML